MIYLSKGMVRKDSTEDRLNISRGGQSFLLTGAEAALWLNGRFAFSVTHSPAEDRFLQHLIRVGLAEAEADEDNTAKYRILSRCVCCPARVKKMVLPLAGKEKEVWTWLEKAGLRLSTAELIYLMEHQIQPEERLLYEENRQVLVETIYTQNTIADNILENQMETADCRDEVVQVLLQLLKKKRILVL